MKNKKMLMLSFVVLSAIITGCKPSVDTHAKDMEQIQQLQEKLAKTQQTLANMEQKHPANLVGKWKADVTMENGADVTIGITTETNGAAVFGEQTTYTFARGDSLPLIAREFSVPVNQILQANPGLTEFHLPVGEKILIQTETITGSWKQPDDYLIVERSNGGFVAFRISSQSTNQLTVFSRTGQTIQFNRIP